MYGYSNPTIRSTEDGEQVGPKMHSAVIAVGRRVYQSKNELAKRVGPNSSQKYGYNIVDRCVRKNLLAVHPEHEDANPHGRGAVVLTDKGARYLNEHTDADLNPGEFAPADARWSELNGEWTDY
jgi:hypothetical protein